ncbi:hypothetical protein BDL97_13G015200 [Sphagnum fallax]|nr:hypothetical protein BDL97_13G015200 [Sphagnum fallax]
MVDDMQQDGANSTNFGRMVVLPASFVGSLRHMNQLYQHSMAFVRKFGKPDLFITVMCNPNWPKILHELRRGEETNDRPDLTSKVFNMKLNALFKDLLQNGVLGTAVANIHVDQPCDNNKYDRIVCAELLDKSTHPELYNIVTSRMLHGPFWDTNVTNKFLLLLPRPCNLGFVFDNRWVVPYNPYLTMRYKCHINVEVYSSITAVKYLYKYVYKGHDPVAGGADGNNVLAAWNEVQNYLDGRYVSASEACHRLFAFDLHGMHPNVYRLAVHLPNEQTTYFPEGTTVGEAMMRNNSTTLTGRNNHVTLGTMGRMYFVQPSKGERYYLRVLLTHVVGATCFEDLRTTHWPHTPTIVVHPTFKAACLARGLLQDDAEWDQCLLKAVGVQLPRSLRQLFASLLIFNNVTPNRQLDQAILDQGLREVEQLLQAQGGKTLEDFELPIPAQLAAPGDTVVSEERARYNVTRQAQQLAQYLPLLNQHQRSIYNNVIDAVHDPRPVDKTFFVDGLGGAGKTFLYGCLLSKVRSTGDIALSMASSSITALLLEGSCTAHSRFKIPIAGLCGSSTCYVPMNSPEAALIRVTRLIHVFEVVNRTLQHVMGALKDILFRGKVVVMGGDFRQLLPVVPRGTRSQIVDATLKRSAILWHNVKGTEQVFPEVGEESILIPENMCCQGDTINSLVNEVYGDLGRFTDSAILTPLNEDVDSINTAIMNRFDLSTPDGPPTQRRTY